MTNTEYYTIEKRKYILTDFGKQELINEYSKGYSQIKICKKFGVSEETLRRWFKEENIPTRKRKYPINENYFHCIDSQEKAYWLGFLAADGYISNDRGSVTLELQESDIGHVQKFAKTLDSTIPIRKIIANGFTHYRYAVRCRKMVEDLKQYNVIQNKSLTFYPINIPEEFVPYWILGYMDGDGCVIIAKNRIKISFTGTMKTLEFIKNYFNSTNQIRLEHRCKNTFNFTLEVAKSEKFLKDFNYNILDFVLERKQKRYCSFIQ